MKINMFIAVAALFALASCGSKGGNTNESAGENTDSLQKIEAKASEVKNEAQSASTANADIPTFDQVSKFFEDAMVKKLPDNYPLLKQFGMTCLKYDLEHDEEAGDFIDCFYGRNATVKEKRSDEYDDDVYNVVPTGKHAFVLRLSLATDNNEYIYFSDKADYENFLRQIGETDNSVERQGQVDGMYLIVLHMW